MVSKEETKTYDNKFTLIMIPGMGVANVKYDLWYEITKKEILSAFPNANVVNENFPDPLECREHKWIPFIKELFKKNENEAKYVIGHSSGAVAALRLAENFKLNGAIIVAGYTSHLGSEREKNSGYFPQQPNSEKLRPWEWEKMKSNTNWIINVGSKDDKYIPLREIEEISKNLNTLGTKDSIIFEKESSKGHFIDKEFPELSNIFINKVLEENNLKANF